jgi:hypothetical protein
MKEWLYDISADGGQTYTTQWLYEAEAKAEKENGYIVLKRRNLMIPEYRRGKHVCSTACKNGA